ncbi:MAG: HAD family hydrolase [Candidatus Omnitrophota bacterium]|jgi:histidinol-phosphate phosphatase family protein
MKKASTKIVFIDRDGVINVDLIGDYVKSWSEFRFEDGALEAMRSLQDSGYGIIIVSNQAGVGDGVFSEDALWDVHQKMLDELERAGISVLDTYYCLHGKEEGCRCRKPATGLFEKAAHDYAFERMKTYFVGDKASDIEAGKRFGLKTIFVRTGHGRTEEKKLAGHLLPDAIADDLLSAVRILIP